MNFRPKIISQLWHVSPSAWLNRDKRSDYKLPLIPFCTSNSIHNSPMVAVINNSYWYFMLISTLPQLLQKGVKRFKQCPDDVKWVFTPHCLISLQALFFLFASSWFDPLPLIRSAGELPKQSVLICMFSVAGSFYKLHPSEVQSPSIDFTQGRFHYPIGPYCYGVLGSSMCLLWMEVIKKKKYIWLFQH